MFSVALNWLEGIDFETEIIAHSGYVHVLFTGADQSVGDLMSKVNPFFCPFKPVEMLVFSDWAEIIAPSGYVHVLLWIQTSLLEIWYQKQTHFFSIYACWNAGILRLSW